jgi:hypothetical protein
VTKTVHDHPRRAPGYVVAVSRSSNAHRIDDLRLLGWLNPEQAILDVTYGKGRWWSIFRPPHLTRSDRYYQHDRGVHAWDFTDLPIRDASVDVVAFDPPYKLNGTPTAAADSDVDAAYGVTAYESIDARMKLILAGVAEARRVVRPGGLVLVKVMDQVAAKRLHWQTFEVYRYALPLGLDLVEKLEREGGRPQPERTRLTCPECGKHPVPRTHGHGHGAGRRYPTLERIKSPQEHAYNRPSTLLVFRASTPPGASG